MNEKEEKEKFAKALIACNMNPLNAGQLVHPSNFNRAAQIASSWHSDLYVLEIVKKLKTEENLDDEQYIELKLKAIIDDKRELTQDRLKAIQELKDLKGLSKKPQTAAVNIIMPRAIEVPTFSTDDDWEQAAARQQTELLNVSRSKH